MLGLGLEVGEEEDDTLTDLVVEDREMIDGMWWASDGL